MQRWVGVGPELRTDGHSLRIACLQEKIILIINIDIPPLFAPWNNDLGEDEEAIDL